MEGMKIEGQKVLVSNYTFPATVHAILMARGIPILGDVDIKTMNITKEIAEIALDKKIKFIVPVSIFGNPLEHEFYSLRKNGIKIIEDAATSLGSKSGSMFVGSMADVSCFSFHPRKIITTGEGGMITTNDRNLANKFRSFKTFGKNKTEFVGAGTNYKLSDIHSAIGLTQLKKIEGIISKRIKMAKIYMELISKISFLEVQQTTKKSRHTYQSFTCYVNKPNLRNKIMNVLKKNNIESQIGTYALHCLPVFKKCKRKGTLENSEFLYKNSISLPLHEELSEREQEFICKIILKTSS